MPYKNKKDKYRNDTVLSIRKKKKAIELKGGGCSRCGYNKYYGALEFHHTNPDEKEHSWSSLRRMSWGRVIDELEKCELLCANCHREHHAKQFYA